MVITSLDYFTIVITLGCKMDRIEENRMPLYACSLHSVIPTVGPKVELSADT